MEGANTRVYVGNLDPLVTQQEMEEEVRRFGVTTSVWVARSPPGFAFIEFEETADAQACIDGLNGVRLGNQDCKVHFAKNQGRKAPPAPVPVALRSQKHRAILKNLPPSFTWRELKDEMRRIGDIIFADVDTRGDGCACAMRTNGTRTHSVQCAQECAYAKNAARSSSAHASIVWWSLLVSRRQHRRVCERARPRLRHSPPRRLEPGW